MNNNNNQFAIEQLKWLGIYMSVGIIISLLMPFPVSLIVAFGAFIIINFFRRARLAKRYQNIGGVKNIFGSLSSPSTYSNGYSPLKYYCMGCGNEHREIACPRCGSKMKRIG